MAISLSLIETVDDKFALVRNIFLIDISADGKLSAST